MPLLTNHLLALLNQRLESHAVVVWFDPERDYTQFAASLSQPGQLLPGTAFHAYDRKRGFFQLRRDLEPLWSGTERPRLLIYVPLDPKDSHNALVEYSKTGLELGPHQVGDDNTRLHNLARRALQPVLPAAALEKLLKDVEDKKLSLQEIETLAERGQVSTLALLFDTANPADIALRFITDPSVDFELSARSAGPQLAELLQQEMDRDFDPGDELAQLRLALTRHLLTVDLLLSLAENLPPALQTIPLPESPAARQSAQAIIQTWRARRDLSESYLRAAARLETELSLGSQPFNLAALRASQTFPCLEQLLQTQVENALLEKPSPDLLALAQERLGGFWAFHKPEIKLRWQVILDAAQVFFLAQSIRQALKPEQTASALFKRYIEGSHPWCLLETWQRRLERDAHNFDAEDSTIKLVAAAQRAYADTAHQLASRFVRAYEIAGLTLSGVTQQVEIYHDFVETSAAEGPTAYFLVDAFRFEMARELREQLPEDWRADLTPALAIPPTITEIGMAALLPKAERGVAVVPAGPGKLALTLSEAPLKNRPDRVKWLQEHAAKPVVITELNKIAPLKDNRLRAEIKNARLLVVTASDEIDGLWENQPHTARRLHEDVFEQLRRGMRTLFNLGFAKIILAADHGFLMGGNLVPGDTLDAPGGETADLHRRVWVGRGGAAIETCLRKPLSAFGLGGDLELVTPYGMSIFKVAGGSTEYFHGGLSLPEVVIPVLAVTAGKVQTAIGVPTFTWNVKPGSQQITTRFFTVTVEGQSADMFAAAPRLRAELRVGEQVISVPVAAGYGFNDVTRDVNMEFDPETSGQLRSNAITLQITNGPEAGSATLHILDEFGASLYQTSLPLAIAF
jgi:hypothetical protein